jgi:hypothetical protein
MFCLFYRPAVSGRCFNETVLISFEYNSHLNVKVKICLTVNHAIYLTFQCKHVYRKIDFFSSYVYLDVNGLWEVSNVNIRYWLKSNRTAVLSFTFLVYVHDITIDKYRNMLFIYSEKSVQYVYK